MSTSKVLLGVFTGVAIGATLGILFAPDKGKDTRKKLSKKGQELAGELGDKFNEFIDTISQKFETVKDEATGLIENGRVKVNEMMD